MTCYICCENFNKTVHTKIVCAYCDFEACRTCCETYILSETVPKCMNPKCDKEWSRKFLRDNFTGTFLSTRYKTHLEDVLYDQEKALLPATQPLVEAKVRKQQIKQEIDELTEVIREAEQRIKDLKELSSHITQFGVSGTDSAGKPKFVRQCPANGCRGFLSSQWKCGLCEMWSCPDCHEVKGPTRDCAHTCDPNSVETAKMLAKDSKPCPKCQSLIFKIDGCDQMWCTQCHTAFSWRTGKFETHIHNPHYYEWQRQNGGGQMARAAGDVECGREVAHGFVYRLQVAATPHSDLCGKNARGARTYSKELTVLSDTVQNTIHNREVELHRFRTDHVRKNQDLRIRYLEGTLSEDMFKRLVQRSDKRHRTNTEIAQVLQLANTAMTDILYRIMDDLENSAPTQHHLHEIMEEIGEVNKYCNQLFNEISVTYGTIAYNFDYKFHLMRTGFKAAGVKKRARRSENDNHSIRSSESDDESVY